jgi:hypothetical protein
VGAQGSTRPQLPVRIEGEGDRRGAVLVGIVLLDTGGDSQFRIVDSYWVILTVVSYVRQRAISTMPTASLTRAVWDIAPEEFPSADPDRREQFVR